VRPVATDDVTEDRLLRLAFSVIEADRYLLLLLGQRAQGDPAFDCDPEISEVAGEHALRYELGHTSSP
jgi:hypothetical protein